MDFHRLESWDDSPMRSDVAVAVASQGLPICVIPLAIFKRIRVICAICGEKKIRNFIETINKSKPRKQCVALA